MKNLELKYNEEKHGKFFKYGEILARKYFDAYRDFFLKHSYDLEDIKQEAKIKVCETIVEYENKDGVTERSLNKLISNWVTNHLVNIVKKLSRTECLIIYVCSNKNCDYTTTKPKYPIMKKCPRCKKDIKIKEEKNRISQVYDYDLNSIPVKTDTDNMFLFEDIKEFCSDEEYDILEKRFKEGYSYKKLAEYTGKSPQNMAGYYMPKLLKKIKKLLDI